MKIENPVYFGQLLHSKGFRTWVLYMFKHIEGRKFVTESLHNGLFEEFQDIYDGKRTRESINVPPRSGKTTLAKYFIAYSLAANLKCNFIYTSYSQDLLNTISQELAGILQHPIYQAMYPYAIQSEIVEEDPINEFWKAYLQETEGKAKYSSRKIVTKEGGIILFTSIGSTITGFGAGSRNPKGFSGALMIDDANKPADVRSQVMREKVKVYFEETLLSRLNDSSIPIVNIQQRLHVEDLSGFLTKEYAFNSHKKPLLVDGVCQLPSQYTEKRLEEIQKNQYIFSAQYQQEPFLLSGSIFQKDTFQYYEHETGFIEIVQSWDTAYKASQHNDPSVCTTWGIKDNGFYLLDVFVGRLTYPDLKRKIYTYANQNKADYVLIEDKASGQSLIQDFRAETRLPVIAIPVGSDKITRAMECTKHFDVGNIFLPMKAPWLDEYQSELLAFPDSSHDDQVDSTSQFLNWVSRDYLQYIQEKDIYEDEYNDYYEEDFIADGSRNKYTGY